MTLHYQNGPREDDGDYACEFFDRYQRAADEAATRSFVTTIRSQSVVNLRQAVQDIGEALGAHPELLADDSVGEHVYDQARRVVRERDEARAALSRVRALGLISNDPTCCGLPRDRQGRCVHRPTHPVYIDGQSARTTRNGSDR